MQASTKLQLVTITGMALFAMFFGAGNIIFPLKIGSLAGQNILPAIAAFILAGVGVPFLGLFAVSLYEGNYWQFFQRVGKVPAFLIITFLILIIGPFFGAPRTEVVTYNTLMTVLPASWDHKYLFDFIYFFLVFVLVRKQSRVVDLIGWLLSPVKIAAFCTLIALGVYTAAPLIHSGETAMQTFNTSITAGYGTMDLLGAFFFCTVAYKNIVDKCHKAGMVSRREIIKMTLLSCIVGAVLIGMVYIGLAYTAATHAASLQNIPTEALIGKVSYLVLGQYGSVFVGICVTFACLATAAALAEVTTEYFYRTLFREKLPRIACLLLILSSMYAMAILGFDGIMKIAVPILNVIYPALIVLCVVNIFLKLSPWRISFRRGEQAESA